MTDRSNIPPQAFDANAEQIIQEEHDCDRNRSSSFLSLPSEVLILQLSFLGIREVEKSIKLTCKALFTLCNSQPLWREYCLQTGKIDTSSGSRNSERNNGWCHSDQDQFDYKELYISTPCVPVDFRNITTALNHYPIVKDRLLNSSFTITLMPGVYNEQIEIVANKFLPVVSDSKKEKHSIQIRAAFPDKGAAIVHYNQDKMNQPCVSIINQNDNDNHIESDENSPVKSMLSVTLQHIQFLHFTKGSDIWNGNCALQADGRNLIVNIFSCSFQSDSGRGIGM
jgi:hypothetical protein